MSIPRSKIVVGAALLLVIATLSGITWNAQSLTSAALVVALGLIALTVMLTFWAAPRQTLSESIREARR